MAIAFAKVFFLDFLFPNANGENASVDIPP